MELSSSKIKKCLTCQEIELPSSHIKNFLSFSQKNAFLILQEMQPTYFSSFLKTESKNITGI